MAIDWVAVAVLGAAWAFSQVKAVPMRWRYLAFALAGFGLAGYRLSRGGQSTSLIFVAIAAGIGVRYLMLAIQARSRE